MNFYDDENFDLIWKISAFSEHGHEKKIDFFSDDRWVGRGAVRSG